MGAPQNHHDTGRSSVAPIVCVWTLGVLKKSKQMVGITLDQHAEYVASSLKVHLVEVNYFEVQYSTLNYRDNYSTFFLNDKFGRVRVKMRCAKLVST